MGKPDMTNLNRQAVPEAPLIDPLLQATRQDLIALIQQQAEENQALRDQAEHFEHLYLDIIHSTAGNWPGRSAPPSRSCPGARTA